MKAAIFIDSAYRKIAETWARLTLPNFGRNRPPKGFSMALPRVIRNPQFITTGKSTYLGPNSVLFAITAYESRDESQIFSPSIKIGNGIQATESLQIYAASKIEVEDNVLFAKNVFISDCSHGFQQTDLPISEQPLTKIAPIKICRGSWIGQNCVILPGVTIGKNCVIGANSVVSKSIPDFCVAAGAPAMVIKRLQP